METVRLGPLEAGRFIIGGNPFSGNSHQSPEADRRMRRYFTAARIKETLREAERLGITTFIGRADNHIVRVLEEYRAEGGTIRWVAQTCPELGSIEMSIEAAVYRGAAGCFIHGGVMDHLLYRSRMRGVRAAAAAVRSAGPVVGLARHAAAERLDRIPRHLEAIRKAGLAAGVAGHNPAVFAWAEKNLDADFYMCSYYNPTSREKHAGHVAAAEEWFREEDRLRMAGTIAGLSKPVIHYKVLAAGRNDPAAAFRFVAGAMRPSDAVCVGVCQEDRPGMLEEDVRLLFAALAEREGRMP